MKDDIIILQDEELIQINGAAGAVTIVCDSTGAALGAMAGGPAGAAVGAAIGNLAANVINGLPTINADLGGPGTFNPYSNPIACEYGY
jgi:hypothetical protein